MADFSNTQQNLAAAAALNQQRAQLNAQQSGAEHVALGKLNGGGELSARFRRSVDIAMIGAAGTLVGPTTGAAEIAPTAVASAAKSAGQGAVGVIGKVANALRAVLKLG